MNKKLVIEYRKKKIDEIEKQCEQSLDEILRAANEVTEISKETEQELVHQTEKIKHISKETEEIEENLKKTEQHLINIKYWWYSVNSFFGIESFFQNKNKNVETEEKNNLSNNNIDTIEKEKNKDIQKLRENIDIKKKKSFKENQSFEEKYQRGLSSLSNILDELHSRAVQMGNTITEQNKILNKVNEKMESNITNIIDQQKMMKEIMKR